MVKLIIIKITYHSIVAIFITAATVFKSRDVQSISIVTGGRKLLIDVRKGSRPSAVENGSFCGSEKR